MITDILFICAGAIAGRLKGMKSPIKKYPKIAGKVLALSTISIASLTYLWPSLITAILVIAGFAVSFFPGVKRSFLMWDALPDSHADTYKESIGALSRVPHCLALILLWAIKVPYGLIMGKYLYLHTDHGYRAYGVCFSIMRGLYMALPISAISLYQGTPLMVLVGLGGMLSGLCYYIGGKVCPIRYKDSGAPYSYRVQCSEILTGALYLILVAAVV